MSVDLQPPPELLEAWKDYCKAISKAWKDYCKAVQKTIHTEHIENLDLAVDSGDVIDRYFAERALIGHEKAVDRLTKLDTCESDKV